jgi:lipooligosaccharide transport system permease protein
VGSSTVSAPASVAARVARAVPVPATAHLARRLVERNARASRRAWLTVLSGFFEPVFYLFSLGVGIGALVPSVTTDGGRAVPYAAFVAPALLASSAMNGAVFDSTINVFFKLKYARLYDSVLATPLGPRDVAVAEITWALLRGQLYAVAFLLIALADGLVRSWWALLALPAAALLGFAFAAVGMAATTFMRSWTDFDYIQLAILPLLLFSATFYPLSTYPRPLQRLVELTPLYHGVALERALLLGSVGPGLLWHVAYLLVMGVAGYAVAARRLERLLLS